jgi:phenylacetate-coenzyme A ligase PaaK-like adenylate-forming protein
MNEWLELYHRMPGWARSTAATLRGAQLLRQRFGPETDRLVEEAMEREYWSAHRWRHWQQERLAGILHRAATRVPFYRELWAGRRRRGDYRSWEHLENWPILEGETLRARPLAFLADDCRPRRMLRDHTSGTSGRPLQLWRSARTLRARYALYEARHRLWYGVSRRDRWAMLGGQLVVPFRRSKPPFWVWNAAMKQLYVSSYHLAPRYGASILEALERYDIRYLWGYPSSLYALAEAALASGFRRTMRVAVANAEPVLGRHRQAVRAAFCCALRETYGMVELVAAAGECEFGELHSWPEMGWLEILADGWPVEAGQTGDLVCTSLLDADMPLIRYRLGDRGARPAPGAPCPCGRTLPLLAPIEGRADDVLYTADGRRIGRLDPVFKSSLPIREAQIVQVSLRRVVIRFVPAADYTAAAGASLREALQARMGPVAVALEPLEEIPRGPNGKFRAVLCEIPPAQRPSAARQRVEQEVSA